MPTIKSKNVLIEAKIELSFGHRFFEFQPMKLQCHGLGFEKLPNGKNNFLPNAIAINKIPTMGWFPIRTHGSSHLIGQTNFNFTTPVPPTILIKNYLQK
jgi:hypothetical protein